MENEEITAEEFALKLLALEADPAFEKLKRSQERVNFFRIVGNTNRERWHSAFWAWVLDTQGSHGCGALGIRRLLAHSVWKYAVKLEQDSSDKHWRPKEELKKEKLSLPDIIRFEPIKTLVAPGPISDFRETALRSNNKEKERDFFDILIVLEGAHPSKEKRRIILVIVIELKVKAEYNKSQLEGYSGWLHKDLSPKGLLMRNQPDFQTELKEILFFDDDDDEKQRIDRSEDSDLFSMGVFLSQEELKDTSNCPESLKYPWASITYDNLVVSILEPMLSSPSLNPEAKPIIQAYIDLTAIHLEMVKMPTKEHQKLVRALFDRHKETFSFISKVLVNSKDLEGAVDVGNSIQEEIGDQERVRAESLGLGQLIDSGLAKIEDELEYIPTGIDPFKTKIIARIARGDRKGLEYISGPAEIDKEKMYTATGLLETIFSKYGKHFGRNGNIHWKFKTGISTGRSLLAVYDQLRSQQTNQDDEK